MSPVRVFIMLRRGTVLALCGFLALDASGCQSTRSFSIDSNSRVPWFGLDLSLPKPSARRKTLETISDSSPGQSQIDPAHLRSITPAETGAVRALLPKWLGGQTSSLPLPPEAPRIDAEPSVSLGSPVEAFR